MIDNLENAAHILPDSKTPETGFVNVISYKLGKALLVHYSKADSICNTFRERERKVWNNENNTTQGIHLNHYIILCVMIVSYGFQLATLN